MVTMIIASYIGDNNHDSTCNSDVFTGLQVSYPLYLLVLVFKFFHFSLDFIDKKEAFDVRYPVAVKICDFVAFSFFMLFVINVVYNAFTDCNSTLRMYSAYLSLFVLIFGMILAGIFIQQMLLVLIHS